MTMAGVEAGLIFALRHGISHGTTWPTTLMAALAALFLALGVLRHYVDVFIHRTVRCFLHLSVPLIDVSNLGPWHIVHFLRY